jgi:Lon protease-like protein
MTCLYGELKAHKLPSVVRASGPGVLAAIMSVSRRPDGRIAVSIRASMR